MAKCYGFKLRAVNGAMAGAMVLAGDIGNPEFADVTSWDVISGGGFVIETISAATAATRYEGYIGECPPPPEPVDENFLLLENGDFLLLEDGGKIILE